jgi:hypothetical protein
MKGAKQVGGIVGTDYRRNIRGSSITIEKCSYKGVISGEEAVGGIMGYCDGGEIIASKADVELTASNKYAGGIIGVVDDEYHTFRGIIACYATGTMSSTSSEKTFGGLIGTIRPPYYSYNTTSPSVMNYSTITSSITNFDGIGNCSEIYYCASVVKTHLKGTNKGECNNITTFLKEWYQSEYDKYWDYTKTWTWSGKVDGSLTTVSCPRLTWE